MILFISIRLKLGANSTGSFSVHHRADLFPVGVPHVILQTLIHTLNFNVLILCYKVRRWVYGNCLQQASWSCIEFKYVASDITLLKASHSHWDHIGHLRSFPPIWEIMNILQKIEMREMSHLYPLRRQTWLLWCPDANAVTNNETLKIKWFKRKKTGSKTQIYDFLIL